VQRGSILTLAVLSLLLSGCLYSFVGGGLPGHVRTVAVMTFENTTPQPLLESELEARMQGELPRNLGVRLAAEDIADAVVRGRITGYEEVAASVRPTDQVDATVPVLQRQVRIGFEAEIYDMREDRPLWRVQGQAVTGNFQPDSESPEVGRARAIDELVREIVEGAQSQW
jgi:hypothetical protein